MISARRRCFWAVGDPAMADYHDSEWGVPVHDDRRWYEKLVLDGAQAEGTRVVAVGTTEAVQRHVGARTRVIDLRGRAATPGL